MTESFGVKGILCWSIVPKLEYWHKIAVILRFVIYSVQG